MSLSCPVMQSLTSPNDSCRTNFSPFATAQLVVLLDHLVTGLLRPFESPPQEAAAHRQVLRPVDDVDGKNEVNARAEPVEPALFD